MESLQRTLRAKTPCSIIFIFLLLAIAAAPELYADKSKNNFTPGPYSLAEYGRFLAGLSRKGDSPFSSLVKQNFYQYHSKRLQKKWHSYRRRIHKPMKKWMAKHNQPPKSNTTFYPFSGPDLPSVYAVYPNSSRYIMVGLEPPGEIPPVTKMKERQLAQGMLYLNHSLDSFLSESFFYTKKMRKNIKGNPFLDGIINNLLVFMSYMNLHPTRMEYITLDYNGKTDFVPVSQYTKHKNHIKGVKIHFFDPEQSRHKEVWYMAVDVSNMRYLRKNPGAFIWLQKLPDYNVLVKAGSFLLHLNTYSLIKEELLTHARHIVMDDSGIPIRDLQKNNWDIQVYGRYGKMIELFKNRRQKRLVKIFEKQKPKKLPFLFGYGTQPRVIITQPPK